MNHKRFIILLLACFTLSPAATAESPTTQPAAKPSPGRWKIWFAGEATCKIGSLDPKDGYKLQLELQSAGAAIRTARLTDYFQTIADKQLFQKDPQHYAARSAAAPKRYKGHYAVIQPVDFNGVSHYALATRELKVWLGDDEDPVILRKPRNRHWIQTGVTKADDHQSVTYEIPVYFFPARGRAGELKSLKNPTRKDLEKWKILTVRKTYTVTRGSYSIGVVLDVINHTARKLRCSVDQAGPTGITREGLRADQRMAIAARLIDGEIQPDLRDQKKLDSSPFGQEQSLGRSDATDQPVVWLGYVNKFFGSILYLEPREKDRLNAASCHGRYYIHPAQQSAESRVWLTGLWLEGLALGPAGEKNASKKTFNFNLFIGPKLRKLFKETPLYARLNYAETVTTVGSCTWCTFDWLMVGLMWLLHFFSSFLFGNFGLAIILLVLIVRVILHPLTKKGQVSMAKMSKSMAALKPQMDKIKEKYANDKAALNRETMKLYKEHGNPMANMLGCLPMMLQMPIWIALFSGLNSEVALRHAALLPVWITDLAAPDMLFSFGRDLPLVGRYFNLLPLLLTVAMFLQTKFNPAMASQGGSPEQAQQQKMMKYLMPLMMLFFFYKAPSGLTLYIMASTFAGVVEQFFIRKHIREQEELEAASETVVKVSGKGPRDSRPKKPKGPLWSKRG